MRLPVEGFESTDDLHIPIESKYLIGFWLNKGAAAPCKRPSSWMRQGTHKNSFWGDAIRHRIASQVPYIRHWRVKNESYLSAPHEYATWFIDPPYQIAGKNYKHSFDAYASLGKWCRSRLGQTIVCEAQGADWLPFQPFYNSKANESKRGGRISQEVIWQQTNLPSIVMPT